MRRIFIGTLVVLTIALINGCANRKITRVDPNETIDLSGRWNDSDRGGSRPRGEQKSRAY